MGTQYIQAIKREFRDTYKFVPSGGTDHEPNFDSIPDGEYPMMIEGKKDTIIITKGKISCNNN